MYDGKGHLEEERSVKGRSNGTHFGVSHTHSHVTLAVRCTRAASWRDDEILIWWYIRSLINVVGIAATQDRTFASAYTREVYTREGQKEAPSVPTGSTV